MVVHKKINFFPLKALFLVGIAIAFSFGGSQVHAQKGLSIGPAIGGGVSYSKNFILDDTSHLYIKNGLGAYAHGGLELLYGLDNNITFSVGGQFRFKQFNLAPKEAPADLSFDVLTRTMTNISIPMMVHYRIPFGAEGSNKYIRISAGHSLDLITGDSVVEKTPSEGVIDSAGSFTRHEFQFLERKNPTVLLGAGVDLQSDNGSVLNISLMWGIGTGKIFQGNVKEWAFLNKAFDPGGTFDEPEEFPEHYYEWGLRGSTISVRLSYTFSIGKKEERSEGEEPSGDEEPEMDDSSEEEE